MMSHATERSPARCKPAVSVEGLSKVYRVGQRDQASETLAGSALGWLKAPLRNYQRLRRLTRFDDLETASDVIWALRDVSFTVDPGDVVGLIGPNGAGKSTLLKLLSRITAPTGGRAVLQGRLGSLLEVGTGFHGDLTGRENTYLNGAILGMKRHEIAHRFDDIVDFSGVSKFIDTPVKRYSSGMYLRLAFAVAAHLDTEILLVDEVLAVGDVAFQKRCLGKIGEIATTGRTVILVSHNLSTINDLCQRALLLDHGQLIESGPTGKVVQSYLKRQDAVATRFESDDDGESGFQILSVEVVNNDGEAQSTFAWDEEVNVRIDYRLLEEVPNLRVGFVLESRFQQVILRTGDVDWLPDIAGDRLAGEYTSVCTIPKRFLNLGDYFVSLRCDIPRLKWVERRDRIVRFAVGQADIPGGQYTEAPIRPELPWTHRRNAP